MNKLIETLETLEMHEMPRYTWQSFLPAFNDENLPQVLFGYHQEKMDASFAPCHENAICALGKQAGKWVLDYGKGLRSFRTRRSAMKWASMNLAVKVFRDVDFAIYGAGKPDIKKWIAESLCDIEGARGRLELMFDRYGMRGSPVHISKALLVEYQYSWEVERLFHCVNEYGAELDELEEYSVPYSPWLLDLPLQAGTYLVCKFGSTDVQQVELVENDARESELASLPNVVERDGTTYSLLGDRDCANWLWSHCY